MENPFEVIDARLKNIECLLLDIKHGDRVPVAPRIEEEYLTFKQACETFDCSTVTLHKWKKEGRIPFYRIGGRILFKKSDVFGLEKAKIAK
jgi:excisionase family DNA binding protein